MTLTKNKDFLLQGITFSQNTNFQERNSSNSNFLPVQEMKYVERTNGMKSGPLCFAKYLIIWVLQFNLCPPQHTHLFHPLMSHPSFQILLSFFLSFFRSFVLSFFSDKYWYWILWHIITSDQFSSVYLFLLFVLLCMCVCVVCVKRREMERECVTYRFLIVAYSCTHFK